MLKKRLKKAISIFQWLLTAVLVLVVLLLIFTAFNPIKSFQIFRVMSGSMEPKIKVGSVVFVKKVKPEILKKNEVITYTSAENPEMSITHRLVEIEEKEGKTIFKTRGDANNNEDMAEVSPSEIKGKVVFSLPFLGYLSVWIKKPLGFGLLVILPALLIIFSEILSIKKAIEKEVEKKYADAKDAKKEEQKAQKGKQFRSLSLLIFFLLGIGLFQIKPTNAYFSDVLVISGNTFSMASDWVSPEPPSPTGKVVINEVYYDSPKTGIDSSDEWFELYNNSDNQIVLSGWTIEDNTDSDILPKITIDPHSFVIIASQQVGYLANFNDGTGNPITHDSQIFYLEKTIGGGLNNDGDQLFLKDNLGNVVDFVAWDKGHENAHPGWDITADEDQSIARKEKGKDTDSIGDWEVLDDPNPGINPHPPALTEPTQPSPSPTPSPTPEASPTPTPTVEPSPTPEPTLTPTPTPTAEPTPVPSTTPIPSPTPEPSPTALPEPSASPTPSLSPTPSPASELPTYEIV